MITKRMLRSSSWITTTRQTFGLHASAFPSDQQPSPRPAGGRWTPRTGQIVTTQTIAKHAFVLRIAPSGVDRVAEALAADQIIIGWAKVPGLLDQRLDWPKFRD